MKPRCECSTGQKTAHVHETTAAPNSERNQLVHDALWRGSGGMEIAVVPVIFGAAGWLLDGAVGTRPIFTVALVVLGLAAAFYNIYFSYTRRMAEATEERNAAHVETFGTQDAAPRFARAATVDLPSYVLASDVDGQAAPEGIA